MLIPLGTECRISRRPRVTLTLIALNIGVFVAGLVLQAADPDALVRLYRFGHVWGEDLRWYTLITSAFLHGGFWHIFGNMLTLWVFGPAVEDRLGSWWFLAFYLIAGVASGLSHALADPNPAIGASGAIAGVTGAFLVLFPLTRIRALMFFGIIGIVMIPAWWLIGLRIVIDLFSQALSAENGIANLAHLGGYGFGITVAVILLATKVIPREPYDLFSITKHRSRRRAFKRVASNQIARPERAAARHDPVVDEIAERRAKISEAVASDRLDEAAGLYERFVSDFAHKPGSGSLSRDAQLRLASHLLGTEQRRLGADALNRFLMTYPNDPERLQVSILLARLFAHDLSDPTRARELLDPIAAQDADPEARDLAREELAQIPPEITA